MLFLGKFLGLGLVLAALMASLTARRNDRPGRSWAITTSQIGQYVQILFGLQLPEYLLFAALAFTVHAVVNQKYLGHAGGTHRVFPDHVFARVLGIEHNLLVYGASPAWSFTDMRGFGATLGPWAWFKLYWAAWALLLAVAARLLWVRGKESGFGTRLRIARLRFNAIDGRSRRDGGRAHPHRSAASSSTTRMCSTSTSRTTSWCERRADYERLYGKYEGIPQP